MMHLKILLPYEVFFDGNVVKVIMESPSGHFCLLPKHVDFVATIVPGILSLTTPEEKRKYFAVDTGTLVKCGNSVSVSTRMAASGENLGKLKQVVVQQFEKLDDKERLARSATANLEAQVVRRLWELRESEKRHNQI